MQIKEKAAQELAARRSLVQMLTRAVTSGQEEVEDDALQLLLATCSCSPALCEAVCAAGIQKVLYYDPHSYCVHGSSNCHAVMSIHNLSHDCCSLCLLLKLLCKVHAFHALHTRLHVSLYMQR